MKPGESFAHCVREDEGCGPRVERRSQPQAPDGGGCQVDAVHGEAEAIGPRKARIKQLMTGLEQNPDASSGGSM